MLRRHLTFANVVALIALFVSLGGAAYAVSTLPKNSVGPSQLKRSSVTGPKIKEGAITSAKVKDGALLAKDFGAGQLPAGSPGPPGPQGLKGDPGEKGPVGPAGPTASAFGLLFHDVSLTSSFQTVVDIGATAETGHSGSLVVSVPSRIVATAALDIFKPTNEGPTAGQSFCKLQLGTEGSYEDMSQTVIDTFEATTAGQVVYRTVAVTGAIDEPAGTYDIRAVCSRRELAGPPPLNAPLTFQRGMLTVVATGP